MADTHQKALEINLDPEKYGVFAEIGAGQEVARWFFRVGGAAGTIAKTISAYDMTFSDVIYGPSQRYVSEERLCQMLLHEYGLLEERLAGKRGSRTAFFAFADTVAARSFSRIEDTHGWMGIRFQHAPGSQCSQAIIHVRMLDHDSVTQQEALGILGVNLIYASLFLHSDRDAFISSLLDGLSLERVEVDMIELAGPAFSGIDNRLMSLSLVQKGLTHAALISSSGEVVQPAAILYKKPIMVVRGSFRPLTLQMLDMVDRAMAQFVQEPEIEGKEVIVLWEMTLQNLMQGGEISHEDFLARADMLGALGKTVLISNYDRYFRLAEYLFGFTREPIGLAMGVPTLKELFKEQYYQDLPGKILESFGRLFETNLRIYAYPQRDAVTDALIDADNLRVSPHLNHLYAYLRENRFIEPIRGYNEKCLSIYRGEILDKLQSGDDTWELMVPPEVAKVIKERGLWGYGE
ncbi:TonB-dependent receptor [bacterium]|nr:MAG: TonB-dependent receptor [bacterium]